MAFSTVCVSMCDENNFLGKTFATLITFNRLLIVVCSLMCHKRTFINKAFITILMFIKLLTTALLWIIRWDFFIKHASHWSHIKVFYPMCVYLCLTRQSIYHTHSHINGISPLCVLWCLKSPLLWVKHLTHWSHLNGLSSLCVLWWIIR